MYSSCSSRYSLVIFLFFKCIILNFSVTHGVTIISSKIPSSVSSEQRNVSGAKSLQGTKVQTHMTKYCDSSYALRNALWIPYICGGAELSDQNSERNTMEIIGKRIKLLSGIALTFGISYVIYENRDILFDGERFQDILLEKINNVKHLGIVGLIYYSIGLGIWEIFGLPTVPVETVAGMTFNFHHAILASIIGKLFGKKSSRMKHTSVSCSHLNFDLNLKQFSPSSLCGNKMKGALVAFLVGRFFLANIVKGRFAENDILQLVSRSISYKPYRSSLYMKFAPFPELFKNLGLSIMPPVSMLTFVLATFTHGFPYTIL